MISAPLQGFGFLHDPPQAGMAAAGSQGTHGHFRGSPLASITVSGSQGYMASFLVLFQPAQPPLAHSGVLLYVLITPPIWKFPQVPPWAHIQGKPFTVWSGCGSDQHCNTTPLKMELFFIYLYWYIVRPSLYLMSVGNLSSVTEKNVLCWILITFPLK